MSREEKLDSPRINGNLSVTEVPVSSPSPNTGNYFNSLLIFRNNRIIYIDSPMSDHKSPARPKKARGKMDPVSDVPRLPGNERFVSYFFVSGHPGKLEPVDTRNRSKYFELLVTIITHYNFHSNRSFAD